MGDKHCLAIGTVGSDVAVDVGEVVLLVGGHYLPSAFAFGAGRVMYVLKMHISSMETSEKPFLKRI